MNCWIILLLLSCCGSNNRLFAGNMSCGNSCCIRNDCCKSPCIQPRMNEKENCEVWRERDTVRDDCGCAGEDRVREKWTPYTEYNDNDRRDCNCK